MGLKKKIPGFFQPCLKVLHELDDVLVAQGAVELDLPRDLLLVVGLGHAGLVDDLARHHALCAEVDELVHACKSTLENTRHGIRHQWHIISFGRKAPFSRL
jgi:hypothetical protein